MIGMSIQYDCSGSVPLMCRLCREIVAGSQVAPAFSTELQHRGTMPKQNGQQFPIMHDSLFSIFSRLDFFLFGVSCAEMRALKCKHRVTADTPDCNIVDLRMGASFTNPRQIFTFEGAAMALISSCVCDRTLRDW